MPELIPSSLPTEEDYRRYDRIWRKVSPELNPYPEARAAQPPIYPDPAGERCMDGVLRGELDALRDFLREELADAQTYRYLISLAPTPEGKRYMRQLSAEESGHVRALQASHFLATGETYPVTVVLPPQSRLPWRDRLRERYHEEVQGGSRYARAAERTADMCLKKLFERLSADEYRHAEIVRRLIEKTL